MNITIKEPLSVKMHPFNGSPLTEDRIKELVKDTFNHFFARPEENRDPYYSCAISTGNTKVEIQVDEADSNLLTLTVYEIKQRAYVRRGTGDWYEEVYEENF